MSGSVAITPETVAEHGLSEDEYTRVLAILAREPNLVLLKQPSADLDLYDRRDNQPGGILDRRSKVLGQGRAREILQTA